MIQALELDGKDLVGREGITQKQQTQSWKKVFFKRRVRITLNYQRKGRREMQVDKKENLHNKKQQKKREREREEKGEPNIDLYPLNIEKRPIVILLLLLLSRERIVARFLHNEPAHVCLSISK
jgi:hypothetical protein